MTRIYPTAHAADQSRLRSQSSAAHPAHQPSVERRELQTVDDHLDLEAMRFKDRLNVRREIEPATLSAQVPPMSVQTLVENAIKYGVSRYPDAGEIVISSRLRNGEVILSIPTTARSYLRRFPKRRAFSSPPRSLAAPEPPISRAAELLNHADQVGRAFATAMRLRTRIDLPVKRKSVSRLYKPRRRYRKLNQRRIRKQIELACRSL